MDVFAGFTLPTHVPPDQIFLRLVMAVALAGVIGFEREMKERTAGLRTHMMTALAAALFSITTFELFHAYTSADSATSGSGNSGNLDPIRVVEAVTTGVSFIATGAIIQSRGSVRGLTTGAGLWMAGAIGVACGTGFFLLAIMAVALGTVILIALKWFEKHVLGTKAQSDDAS